MSPPRALLGGPLKIMMAPVAWNQPEMRLDGQKNVLLLPKHSLYASPSWEKEHRTVDQKVRNSPGSHAGRARRESEQGPVDSGVGAIPHGKRELRAEMGDPKDREKENSAVEEAILLHCLFSSWDSAWYTVGAA